MNNNFDFKFWEIEFRARFELNRIATSMLQHFIYHNPKAAKDFIIDTYQSKVEKYDLLDKYCDKYDSKKINDILKQIDFEELTDSDMEEFGIQFHEETEESEEM